jgi:hypothetical protein
MTRWRCLVLLLLGLPQTAIRAQPATAPAKDVEVAITKIDPAAATVVSAKLKDASASEMFAKLADAAGVVITPSDEGVFDDPSLQAAAFSTQWDHQPFWEAVREACESTNLRPLAVDQDNIGNAVLRVTRAGGAQRAPASVDGISLVQLRGVMRDATLDYAAANRKTGDRVHVTLAVLLEPKARGWAWIDPPRVTQAADERGRAMATTRAAGGAGAGAGGERAEGHSYLTSSDVSVMLDYPPQAGKKLALLEGSIPVHVASEMATVTFNRRPLDRAGGAAGDMVAQVGNDKLLLKSFTREQGGAFKLTMVLTRGPKETDPQWKVVTELISRFLLRPTLLCPNGPAKIGSGGSEQGEGSIRFERSYPSLEADNQPTAVQVQLPGEFETVNVKFSFKDVAMP